MLYLNTPLLIKQIIFKNRVVMSPMCQYSAINGYANEWHFVHYATRAVGGVGTIIQEATAVLSEGRITYGDLGLWEDEQIAHLARITSLISNRGAVPGIQLAHAGRKASCDLPWNGGEQLQSGINSWETYSASPIPFHKGDNLPIELSKEEIDKIVDAFYNSAVRAIEAGYKIIEIHGAHGYLIHQFLSPLSNKRDDEYGGTFENRTRFLLQIIERLSGLMDENHSLWVRISATDWTEGGWNIDDSVKLATILKNKGVDVIDTSTGGLLPGVKIPVAPGYQVPFASQIKKKADILTGAVGEISTLEQIEELLESDKCDFVFLGRKLLRHPYFILHATHKTDDCDILPVQYERAY